MGAVLTKAEVAAQTLVSTLNHHREEEAPVFMRYTNPLDCPVCTRLIDELEEALNGD